MGSRRDIECGRVCGVNFYVFVRESFVVTVATIAALVLTILPLFTDHTERLRVVYAQVGNDLWSFGVVFQVIELAGGVRSKHPQLCSFDF